jgi:hypothetical protein
MKKTHLFFSNFLRSGGKQGKPQNSPSAVNQESIQQQEYPKVNQEPERQETPLVINPYFEGDGGKGLTLAVFEPTGVNLSDNEKWILPLIQGILNTEIKKISQITIIDRQNLEKTIEAQQESVAGDYSDMANARNILTGKLTKTPLGYTLELAITDMEKNERKASYGPQACTTAALEDFSTVKAATKGLLEQFGVELTSEGTALLLMPANNNQIQAETALSKGITAQKSRTLVEALSYYYDAVSFGVDLPEAASRLSMLSNDISSGNIRENLINDIQRRKEWKKILDEADAFFQQHLPFEIIYDEKLKEEQIDYANETIDLSCSIESKPNNGFKILEAIKKGLAETGKVEEWGFIVWPVVGSEIFINNELGIDISAALYNDKGKQLSTVRLNITNSIKFQYFSSWPLPLPNGYIGEERISYAESVTNTTQFSVNRSRYNDDDIKTYIKKSRLDLLDRLTMISKSGLLEFKNVNANDITGNLTIKIISINGIDADNATKSGYIRISSR